MGDFAPFAGMYQAGVGLHIVERYDLVASERTQVRFPRSKKRRIRKKWAQRRENYDDVPQYHAIRIGNTWYMHPALLAELQAKLKRANDERVISLLTEDGPYYLGERHQATTR